MTLTYPRNSEPCLVRVLWLVTGEEKSSVLARLLQRDPAIPAGRVCQDHAVVLADLAANADL